MSKIGAVQLGSLDQKLSDFPHFSPIATIIRNHAYQIPQARPADRLAFRYKHPCPQCRLVAGFAFGKSGGQVRFAKDHFGSQKPKLPQRKPAGFIGPRFLSCGDRREVSSFFIKDTKSKSSGFPSGKMRLRTSRGAWWVLSTPITRMYPTRSA